MKFTKMHGIGNDYIYINCFQEMVENPKELAIKMSDRHFGVGSDGLILIKPSKIADCYMEMYNADGSRGEMCGNGIRCVGKYVYDNHMIKKETILVETLAGIKELKLHINEKTDKVEVVTVNMGEPILEAEKIPVKLEKSPVKNQPIWVEGDEYKVTCVSMGNPHVVTVVEDLDKIEIEKIGSFFENHVLFPNKINTEFIQIIDETHIKMRVWERGSGETLACGTGACASVCAAVLNGWTKREVEVTLLGGKLNIFWNFKDNHVYMTGTAEKVFDGEYTEC